MSKFTEPVERIVREGMVYADRQLDNVKLRTVKGLSEATSAMTGILLIALVAGIFLLFLSFAFVVWLGELLDSYSLAAFIVAGVLLLILLVLVFLRKRLFKDTFVSTYSGILMPGSEEKSIASLDKAIETAEGKVRQQQVRVQDEFVQLQSFYTPSHLLNEGLRQMGLRRRSGLGTLYVIPALIRRLARKAK